MEPQNYNGEEMLVGANLLNIKIKNFINEHTGQHITGFVRYMLAAYIVDINKYITRITEYNFAPRTDRLTKEGILIDLENTKARIYSLFPRGGRIKKSRVSKRTRKTKKPKRTRKFRTSRRQR